MTDDSATDGTVLVTGATGRVGPTVITHLTQQGYRTVAVSRSGGSVDGRADASVRADCTVPGDVYGALERTDPDAIVHLGTRSTPRGAPGHVTFESQVDSTYLVCEAASAVGVDRVVVASSLAALGTSFGAAPVDVEYLPVDESHPTAPQDPYGVGKLAAEVAAAGVARRPDGPDVVSFRFPLLVDDATLEETFRGTDRSLAALREADLFAVARDTLFSWLHVDDAARAVGRAIEAPIAGQETLYLAAADTTVDDPTDRVVETCYPAAEVRGDLSGRASLVDTTAAERLLGWSPSVRRLDP
jgi:nucleoside-diphosphate-sugar epimerase